MPLVDVLREIRDDLRTLTGLSALPDQPPEQLNEWPALLVYAREGFWRLGTASGATGKPMRWGIHTIRVALHVERGPDLARATAELMPFAERIPHALFAGFYRDRFGGTVVLMGDPQVNQVAPITYEVGPDIWGGIETLALRCGLQVAAQEEIEL